MYKPFPPRNRIQTSIHMYMFKDVYHTIVYNGKQTINGCFFFFLLSLLNILKKNHMLPILNPPPSQPPHTIPNLVQL